MATDDLLFVEHAVKRGLVTEEQVDEIMRIQEKVAEMGVPDSIPALMVKRGVLSSDDAEKVLAELRPRAKKEQIPGYRLLRRLGHGGMGSVYLARQVAMDRLVALKVLRPTLTKDPLQIERLHREAQLVGRLSHPNIVGGLDRGEAGGFQYFAMEYIEGVSLKDRLNPPRPMGEAEALKVVRCVAQALEHAWDHGIAHRDIKPGNILLRPDGTACVMDYGLAKGPLDVSLTVTGTTLGTPQYLSPEQAKNPRDVDIRTDIYALGATLFHMLTGKPPFNGENLAEIVTQVLMKPHDPPQSLNPKITVDTAFLIDKMMAKDPRNRHATPRDLLRDLEAIERGRSIVPAGWEGDWKTFVLKRRMKRITVGIVAAIVLLAAGFTYWMIRQAEEREELAQDQAEIEFNRIRADAVTYDTIEEHLQELEDLATIHGDRLPGLPGEVQRWRRILAKKVRIEATLEGYRAALAKPEELEFVAGRATLTKLLEDHVTDGRPEVVRVHLEELGSSLRSTAEEQANRLAKRVHEDAYASPGDYVKRLEALLADFERRWPEDWVPDLVRTGVEQKLPHARVLRDWLSSLRRLTKDNLDQCIVEFRFKDAMLELGRWDDQAGRNEDLDAARSLLSEVAVLVAREFARVRTSVEQADADRTASLVAAAKMVLERSNDPEVFADTIGELEWQIPNAIGSESPRLLTEQKEKLEAERDRRIEAAEAVFASRIDEVFYDRLRRQIDAARNTLDELRETTDEDGRLVRPWIASKVEAAEQDFERVASFWTSLEDGLRAKIGKPITKLFVKGVGHNQWVPEALEGWTLRLRAPGGQQAEVDIRDVRLEDALYHAGLAGDGMTPELRMKAAIIEFILTPRDTVNGLAEIERIDGLLQHITEGRYEEEAKTLKKNLEREQAKRELRAERELEEADDARFAGDFDTALRGYARLLNNDVLRHTKVVVDNLEYIKEQRQYCESKVGDEKLSGLFPGGRFEFRDPLYTGREVRASVTYRFEDEVDEDGRDLDDDGREFRHLGLNHERAKFATVDAPDPATLLGPPAPTDHMGPAGPGKRHVLVLVQGDTPEDFLQYHPLQIQTPFVGNAPMALEVDIRSPVPVFTAISLGGYVCAILSQRDRVEGGTGVAFFTARKLEKLDEHKALQGLRHPARRTVLENARSPLERLNLTERDFFWMKPDRWYRLRFEKGPRRARLLVDGRVVGDWPVPVALGTDRRRVMILTYTTTLLDNLRLEGTVDGQWLRESLRKEPD